MSEQRSLLPEVEEERRLLQPPFYEVSIMASEDGEYALDGDCYPTTLPEDWQPEWIGITKWEVRHALSVLHDMGYDNDMIQVERMGMTQDDHKQKYEHEAKFKNTRKRDR